MGSFLHANAMKTQTQCISILINIDIFITHENIILLYFNVFLVFLWDWGVSAWKFIEGKKKQHTTYTQQHTTHNIHLIKRRREKDTAYTNYGKRIVFNPFRPETEFARDKYCYWPV